MRVIEAEAGENVFNVAGRACQYAWNYGETIKVQHNGASVTVYPMSHDKDIAEKLTLMQEINRIGAGYRR